MIILSIDSSQPVGSVTLARASESTFDLIATTEAHGGKFSAQLVPTVKKLLAAHNVEKHQVDVLAAASGPGTFTGLRVGLAAVKALAEMLNKPVVLVSVLEAMAATAHTSPAAAIADAGKGFWYVGIYGSSDPIERHCSTDHLLALLKQQNPQAIVTNASLPADLGIADTRVSTPISELVAVVAIQKARRGEFIAIDAIDANYVRQDEGLYRTS